MMDDDLPTSTSVQQSSLEKKILSFYQEFELFQPDELQEVLLLLRPAHVAYLHTGLGQLPASFASLDASRPWICYWILHSLALLDGRLPDTPTADDVVFFLSVCADQEGGGYGGGPCQMAHMAPTYAAVCALLTLGTNAALRSIDRQKVYQFLSDMVIPPERGGGFSVHKGGEGDLRACYIAMAVAHMLCLDKAGLARRAGMVEYVARCQTYEGGLGGEPGTEAHGGYTFCGLAALALIDKMGAIDVPRLTRWAVQRQASCEGGFNGRTNKLADGCYSLWQGGLFPLLQRLQSHGLAGSASFTPGGGGGEGAGGGSGGASAEFVPLPEVPPLPMDLEIRSPVEQAQVTHQAKSGWAQAVVAQALQAGDAADAAMAQGATARATADMSRAARVQLDQAAIAQGISEAAYANVNAANNAACVLFPVPDPTDPPLPSALDAHGRSVPNPPLYNYKALQLWILRCCQQAKGGLRDKPGKPTDFYHTCFCLSGLSSAQHCSNAPLGPPENMLRRSDPMVNVVDDRLKAAQVFFRSCSPVTL